MQLCVVGSKVTLVSPYRVLFIFCTASLANSATLTPEQVSDASDEDAAAKLTTTGEGKIPPLAEDLKEAIRGGVQVPANAAPTSDIAVPVSNKLNPAAKTFSPTSLDLNSIPSLTTPSRSTATTESRPIYTKNAIPTATSSTASSRLDPKVKEFVPEGVPMDLAPVSNGDVSLYGNGDVLEEEGSMSGYLDSKDIMQRFERAAPTESTDTTSKIILQEAAEMLLKVYNYPGSFDEIGKTFQFTLNTKSPTDDTLINLAEMLVYWVSYLEDCSVCEIDVECALLGCHFTRVEVCFKPTLPSHIRNRQSQYGRVQNSFGEEVSDDCSIACATLIISLFGQTTNLAQKGQQS